MQAKIEKHFGETDLYKVLGISKDATESQLKTAYRKKALKFHPDKNPDDAAATEKFQLLCTIHAILSNPESRAVYDETGEIDSESLGESQSFQDWVEYWRAIFPPVTEKDISSFETKYRGSDEEAKDVLDAYVKYKGKWKDILDVVMLSRDEDVERFSEIIQSAIDEGKVDLYPAFSKKPVIKKAQKKKAEAEAKAAEELFAKIRGKAAGGGPNALAKRGSGFGSLLANLEEKYAGEESGKKSRRKSKSKQVDEPSEEEFQAAQRRLEKRKRKN